MAANPDDYSPAATLITFDRPIPLLRQPILAGEDDSLVLAFKNRQSFESAYKSCESNIIQQCEAGARIGCSVSASRKCAPPWWKSLTGAGGVSKEELIEREKCEEREMADCLEASRSSCRKFAGDKCLPVFRDARIVVEGGGGGGGGGKLKRCVSELVSRVWIGGKSVGGVELWKLEVRSRIGVSVVRGSDLLDKRF